MTSINSSFGMLGNLATSLNKSKVDPKKYESFTVGVGTETGPGGIWSGTLSQGDHDKFVEAVKDINVMDASADDMWNLVRRLENANLLKMGEPRLGTIFGSLEFDPASGRQINSNAKYNQLEYQRLTLPNYAGTEFNETRGMAIDSFKFIAAVADASPVTGATVAAHAFSPQERAAETELQSPSFHLHISDMAQLLSRGEDVDAPKETDVEKRIKLIMALLALEKAQNATEAAPDGEASTETP